MRSRLEKYDNTKKEPEVKSRMSKNKYLYDDLNNKIGFEEIVDFNTQTKIELTSLNENKKSRESYQQLKDYQKLINPKEEIQDEVKSEEAEKIFDINTILEEARKNRNEIDELETKRKLKNDDYNILSDLNKKYLSEKEENSSSKAEYEGLEELINTITSKTLVQDINDEEASEEADLLGDLVATSVDLQVKPPESHENTNELDQEQGVEEENDKIEEKTVDESFYTRSMDLSEQDFDFDEAQEKKASVKKGLLITIIVIILLVIIAIVSYFVLKHFNIDITKLF